MRSAALYPAGTVFCCTSGHPMYRLVRDVHVGQMRRSSDIESVDPSRIPPGGTTARCPQCRAPWTGPFDVLNPKVPADA